MTSAIGCSSTLSCTIKQTFISPDFTCDSITDKCYPSTVHLAQYAYASGSNVSYWEWNISKISENKGTEYVSGDSSVSYTFKDTGFYKLLLTVYTENGCADTASVIVYSYPGINVKINTPSIICKNIETEIVAVGADEYEWKNVKRVQSDSSAIIDRAGVYIVKGTNALGCSYDTAFVDDMEFGIRYATKHNRCVGMDSGEIKITGITGDYLAPVNHYWEDLGYTNGLPVSERKNLYAGKYFVYSIDDNNCFRYDTIEIKEPLVLGAIGEISGDSIVSSFANYTYSITPVQGATLYYWFVEEITQNGSKLLFDRITTSSSIVISINNLNPIQIEVFAFNGCDTTDKSSLLIQVQTDIVEKTEYKGMNIFPNPTSDKLTIQSLNGNLEEIKIFDVVGKEVKRLKVNTTESVLDLSNLQNGLYIIWVNTENGIVTAKILKK